MCAEPRRPRAHGQALVELLVALIALLPLFFGMAWLAKVLDMQQATIAAARALAFECTVRLVACRDADGHPELAVETRRRFFAAHRLGLRSDDAATGVPASSFEPRKVGQPLTQMRSLIEVGTPSMGPCCLPASQRASLSRA
jgi:hypothetical protein